jgi:hypothetical protein
MVYKILTVILLWAAFLLFFKQESNEDKTITCTADNNLVTLYNKNHTKAKLILTCNGQKITIDKLNVGYMVYDENKRILGLDKKEN